MPRPIQDLVPQTLEQLVSSIWRRKTVKIAQYQQKYVRELVKKSASLCRTRYEFISFVFLNRFSYFLITLLHFINNTSKMHNALI